MTDLQLPVGPVHGSCVSLHDQAVLIIGPSGAGKSELALALMAFGAGLIADDQVVLSRVVDHVEASALPTVLPLIEARKTGLLGAELASAANLSLIVDLAVEETQRLPRSRKGEIDGVHVDLINGYGRPHLEYIILQMLKGGRIDPDAA